MRDMPASSDDSTTRHAGGEIGRQRMVLAAYAEDEVSAGEADLDGDRPRAHLGKQAFHVAFEGKRDAMADAAGASDLDGLADVEGKIGRRNEPEPQLARVQRHRHVAGEKTDDLHVAGVV